MYKSQFVTKLLKYRILFKDILTFLGLDFRDVSLITLYLVVIGIRVQKNQTNLIIITQKNLLSQN